MLFPLLSQTLFSPDIGRVIDSSHLSALLLTSFWSPWFLTLCRPLNWCSLQTTRHFSLAAFKMFSVLGFQKFNYGGCWRGFLWVPPRGGGRSHSFLNLLVYVFCQAREFLSYYPFKPR